MKAIILAAGKGERLRPLTDNRQKSLLPVANKPVIDYHLDALSEVGIDEVAVVVGEHRGGLKERYSSLRFFQDEKIKGTASALYAARDFVDDDFILLYGDVFFDGKIDEVAQSHSIGVYRVEDVSKYGEVIIKDGFLEGIREKEGSGEGFINAGIYHLPYEIFDHLSDKMSVRGEYELTDSIIGLCGTKKIKTIPLEGFWRDIGYPWEYIDTNMYMLNKIGFSIGKDTDVWDSAVIKKPCVIGDGCTIKNCVIERSIIGDNCGIGEFSILKRSILMNNTNTPHLNYVADSCIGERCNLGAGTKIANLRFDDKNIKMRIKGLAVNTGRRKLGTIIGDDVKTGINVSIYPGVKIGSGAWIGAETLVRRDVDQGEKRGL